MSTRRYGDDKVREIISLAMTGESSDQALSSDHGGLTLDEIKRIGEEAGIEPAHIARAAAVLDARGTSAPLRRFLGLPIGMSRIVPLSRAPTDREWELPISHFRTTFESPGEASTSGGIRDMRNGVAAQRARA